MCHITAAIYTRRRFVSRCAIVMSVKYIIYPSLQTHMRLLIIDLLLTLSTLPRRVPREQFLPTEKITRNVSARYLHVYLIELILFYTAVQLWMNLFIEMHLIRFSLTRKLKHLSLLGNIDIFFWRFDISAVLNDFFWKYFNTIKIYVFLNNKITKFPTLRKFIWMNIYISLLILLRLQ